MATIIGSDNPELLSGTSTADSMHGYEGADTLYGAGGSDYLSGQSSGNLIYADRYPVPAETNHSANTRTATHEPANRYSALVL